MPLRHSRPGVYAGSAANNYRFSTIVQGVVTSAPFQMRMNAGPSERGRVAVAESRQPAQ